VRRVKLNEFYAALPEIAIIFAAFMRRIHYKVRAGILGLVDFFYPPFRRLMPLQTYRYAACGGSNTLLNLLLFFITHNYILHNQVVHIGPIAISSHIASFLFAFLITFPIGFYLSMYVVFQGSYLKRRVQLFRYFLVVLGCIMLNYICLKVFVDMLGWYPTPSMMVTTVVVILFSYFSQRYFSFRTAGKVV
jgi:putative flippase GtrA